MAQVGGQVEGDERLADDGGQGRRRLSHQPVAGWDGEAELLRHQGCEADARIGLPRRRDDRDVERVPLQLCVEVPSEALAQLEAAGRYLETIATQQTREELAGHGLEEAEPHDAVLGVDVVVEAPYAAGQVGQRPGGVLSEQLAVAVELEPAAVPVEQLHAEIGFQPFQRAGDVRLVDPLVRRGVAHVLGLAQGQEGAQVGCIHSSSS